MKKSKSLGRGQKPISRPIPTVLNPDGRYIQVNWDLFEPGMSVFIPAVSLKRLANQMKKLAEHKGYKIKGVERIESGLLGMRFWRIS